MQARVVNQVAICNATGSGYDWRWIRLANCVSSTRSAAVRLDTGMDLVGRQKRNHLHLLPEPGGPSSNLPEWHLMEPPGGDDELTLERNPHARSIERDRERE